MKLKIAVVQFENKRLAVDTNLKKAENFIKKASNSKAQIIVFPEDFITGPLVYKNVYKLYVDDKGRYRKFFSVLAKKYKIDIVPGSFIEKYKSAFYNTSYYIDKKGEIKAKYQKINLWHSERKNISFGSKISVCNTKYGKIGLIICWDLIFPEIFRKMLNYGAEIIICPSFWCYGDAGKGQKYDKNSEIKLVDSLCIARAFENEIIIVYCNAAGKLELGKYSNTLIGHSQITAPFKGCIKKLEHNKEEMFIEEIDTAILKIAEKAYKIKKDFKNRVLY